MESIPAKSRGWVSGFLQQGYAFGYLIAAVVYYSLFELIGWRGMFVVGVVPALLVLYIRMHVKESPAWQAMRQSGAQVGLLQALRGRWSLFFYVVVLMTAFNFLSHGTQESTPGIADIGVAHQTLIPALGVGAAGVFLVALIASGISSSVVGTMAGHVIMQGFVGFSIPAWARRLITMAPAFVIALTCNAMTAMIISQVVLSFVVPLPLVALVVPSSRKSVMGDFVMDKGTASAAVAATVLIVLLDVVLIKQKLP